ncbi:beta-lactamase/transpeptidase-like protein [Crassisporium funariophilum]|nr:beta-lactamase/transpeptidase-like protein [Crassisporium funariophilum]
MKIHSASLILSALVLQTSALVPLAASGLPSQSILSAKTLISERTEKYIDTLLKKWNSTGLSVAVVRKDDTAPSGWVMEFGAYGIAHADGSPMTPDSVFAIASNSKLFLAFSVGLLISNKTLAEERGQEIKWSTKISDLIPEWGLMDEEMDRGVSLQDMLSHRTGMPRHDFSGIQRKGGVSEMISKLRYLRPSAEFRETFQYNNLMYETLSYLPQVLLNQTYESYVKQHLFGPLNMTASTYSVAEAESRGTLVDGFQWHMRDITKGINGTLVPTVPYFQRPGEERTWAGAGGVLTSSRDLTMWISMLLNDGRHPYTNKTVVPAEVVQHVAYGRTVTAGKPEFPELSPTVYGAGQWSYSYQGHSIIEHGGNNPGYKTQVARFPEDNLGIIALSNDANGGFAMESTKFRIADEILGLKELDWNDRYEKQYNDYVEKSQLLTPRPDLPIPPSRPLSDLATKSFSHPTYGTLQPCIVPKSLSSSPHNAFNEQIHKHCTDLLDSHPVKGILGVSNMTIPTFIIQWKRTFATHLRLAHFSENLFNVTIIWSNAEVREREGYGPGGDIMIGLDEHFEVEWVHGEDEGLAFKGGFWGKEGPDSRSPSGIGKDSAEVWFAKA